jgi:hypothetical protein
VACLAVEMWTRCHAGVGRWLQGFGAKEAGLDPLSDCPNDGLLTADVGCDLLKAVKCP